MNLRLRNNWDYKGVSDNGANYWTWEAFLDDNQTGDIFLVEFVEYVLHPTFVNPLRVVSSPVNGFRMRANGFGPFLLRAFVTLKNGSRIKLEHYIVLSLNPPIGVSQ